MSAPSSFPTPGYAAPSRVTRLSFAVAAAFTAACSDAPTDPAIETVNALAARNPAEICHLDQELDEYLLIRVSGNGSAVDAHLAHGDGFPEGDVPGMGGFVFDEACMLSETIFAIAYTDVDPSDGDGFKAGLDRLIAKLVDANGDGLPSGGDEVITDTYPEDVDATTVGQFAVTRHVIDEVEVNDFVFDDRFDVTRVVARILGTPSDSFFWLGPAGEGISDRDVYSESRDVNFSTTMVDWRFTNSFDRVTVDPLSPSRPESLERSNDTVVRSEDDPFVDVEFNLPPTL